MLRVCLLCAVVLAVSWCSAQDATTEPAETSANLPVPMLNAAIHSYMHEADTLLRFPERPLSDYQTGARADKAAHIKEMPGEIAAKVWRVEVRRSDIIGGQAVIRLPIHPVPRFTADEKKQIDELRAQLRHDGKRNTVEIARPVGENPDKGSINRRIAEITSRALRRVANSEITVSGLSGIKLPAKITVQIRRCGAYIHHAHDIQWGSDAIEQCDFRQRFADGADMACVFKVEAVVSQ
jgi:hypothetical protein